ncbi:hypothetical protein TOL_3422 [Thalassolituus oleivorans MIL-1]|uniref:Uncharacterized protein n=1 Tax=Thalassolituus oleivorans MIL-1 TaxID=1298593 RepID=M5DV95_9GAMM|nr:hypothetical protein TOL_3422 [Thalassolituus oleivorans MIL-1]
MGVDYQVLAQAIFMIVAQGCAPSPATLRAPNGPLFFLFGNLICPPF